MRGRFLGVLVGWAFWWAEGRHDDTSCAGGLGAAPRGTPPHVPTVISRISRRALASDQQVVRRFVREARLANAIGHRGVVAAHAMGVLHRDPTPANLYLETRGLLRVLDFGVGSRPSHPNSTLRTGIGSLLGTPAFMPPEQARGDWERVDARSDPWSLGAVLFASLTGECVHEGRTSNEMLGLGMTRPARSLRAVAPHLSEGIAAFVDKSLAYDPEARWESAGAMQEALRVLMAGGCVAGRCHDRAAKQPTSRRRTRNWRELPAHGRGLRKPNAQIGARGKERSRARQLQAENRSPGPSSTPTAS